MGEGRRQLWTPSYTAVTGCIQLMKEGERIEIGQSEAKVREGAAFLPLDKSSRESYF